MAQPAAPSGTGPADLDLDRVLRDLRPGDGAVCRVEAVDDYAAFVRPFADAAARAGRRLVYFRFARHAPLLEDGRGAAVHRLSPAAGFERFTAEVHRAAEEAGRGACCVFDCLSDLAAEWGSDVMLGNFLAVTGPHLHDLEAVSCFALLRDGHSQEALEAARGSAGPFLDVSRRRGETRVKPLADLAEPRPGAAPREDVWDRAFVRAGEVQGGVRARARPVSEAEDAFHALLPSLVTRDERIATLATAWMDLDDLLAVHRRTIGTGLVGGKAVGMLLARAILARTDPRWLRRLEPHDSWFVGSDVFTTFLVRNGCWPARRAQRSAASLLDGAAEARERLRRGAFPEPVRRRFAAMLEHYGPSPIVVRSSSLLEDGFGNAFTGKYASVFCANQGSPEERLAALEDAVRTVYASAMSEEALRYRESRGLLDRDEQMPVLVQRVSGAAHGGLHFPQVAGVALSYNPWAWDPDIDPKAGVVRLVFGLGTRAVDHADDDYTRLVALNDPLRRPEAVDEGGSAFAQRRVDALDLARGRVVSLGVEEVARASPELPLHYFAASPRGGPPVLTFDRLLGATPFVAQVRELLATLAGAYRCPVEVEFTGNFLPEGELRLNVLQCRPMQVKEGGALRPPPGDLPESSVLLSSRGPVLGQSTLAPVDRVVYVDPDAYAALGAEDRHEVARVVGRVTRAEPERASRILLLGPGRWGTSAIQLGVPVPFAEIRRAAAIGEIVRMGGGAAPSVSLGSHFFNDLVEANMLYLAIDPARPGHRLDEALLRRAPNRLAELLPGDARLAGVVRVVDFPLAGDGRALLLSADSPGQEVLCYLVPGAAPETPPAG